MAHCQNPTELLLPDPCSPKGLQTTGSAPKGPDLPPRGTSYATVFPELWLQPRVSGGRGKFEPQSRGQAHGASLVLMVFSPLTDWEQKQRSVRGKDPMGVQPVSPRPRWNDSNAIIAKPWRI